MANILVVVGSAREGRIADKVLPFVTADLETRENTTVTVADLKEINLPFFNDALSPAQPGFVPRDENAAKWTGLVAEADAIVFLTNEYNHAMSAIMKNALDWIKQEWVDKPVTFVGYGWTGASLGIEEATKVLEFLGAKVLQSPANIFFTKEIAPDGTILDEEQIKKAVKAAVDHLLVEVRA